MKTSLQFIGDYKVLAIIGDGGQANVYLCSKGLIMYAVKVFNNGCHKAEPFIRQTNFLSVLNHQNLIKMVDSKAEVTLKYNDGVQIKKSIIVLEYANKGDLFEYISITKSFKPQYCRAIICKILNALQYLIQKGISHRDIKPQNILFVDNFHLKITDFGLSALSEGTQKNYILKTKVGTEGFKAPEVDNGSYYGQKADIFSIGVILFVLFVGSPPFLTTKSTDKIYKHIINKNYQKFWSIHQKNKVKGFFPQTFKKLLNSLLSSNPSDRPTIQEIKQNEWIKLQNCSDVQLAKQLENRFQQITKQSEGKKVIISIMQKHKKQLEQNQMDKKLLNFEQTNICILNQNPQRQEENQSDILALDKEGQNNI